MSNHGKLSTLIAKLKCFLKQESVSW